MRACVLLCVVGLVTATAPPRIELELAADLTKHSNAPGIVKGATRYHRLDASVTGFQDYTQTCESGKIKGSLHKCRLPTARAYDHFDKQVKVSTQYYLVDVDGKSNKKAVSATYFKTNYWKRRSSWLIKYDATDANGNKARQLVYGLIMNDITKPVIHACMMPTTIEGNAGFKLCGKSYVTDNMDTINANEIKYDLTKDSSYVLRGGSLAQAQKLLNDIEKCGTTFVLTMKTMDHAKSYGQNWRSNQAKVVTRTIKVVDTQKPSIALKGMGMIAHECATNYNDVGASAKDQLDTAWGRKYTTSVLALSKSNTFLKSLASPTLGNFKFCYDTTDKCNNKANQNCRYVSIMDTTKPSIRLNAWNGWKQVVVEHKLIGKKTQKTQKNLKSQISKDTKNKIRATDSNHMVHMSKEGQSFVDPGFTSSDSCADLMNQKIKHKAWWVDTFNDRKVGTYTRKYCATDPTGNQICTTREVVVVDAQAPIITVSGKSSLTVEAHPTKRYVDAGATCSDYVDGGSKLAVVTGGQSVFLDCNRKLAGRAGRCTQKYTITYDCEDTAGLKAKQMNRFVFVRDTTKPKVAILGSATYQMEAGFDYTDAGAKAHDSLDGDITSKIYVDGNTVMTRFAYTSHTSCADVKAQFADRRLAKDGNYVITNMHKKQISVWCHMSGNGLTLLPATSYFKIRPYYTARGSVCGSKGLDMLKYDKLTKHEKLVFKRKYPNLVPSKDRTGRYSRSNSYVCSTNDQHIKFDRTTKDTRTFAQRMRKGSYRINYFVSDRAGNAQVKVATRHVKVIDTLPPVISLHLKGHLIQKSASKERAVHDNKIRNPAILGKAWATGSNPFLKSFEPKMEKINVVNTFPTFTKFMAESSSVNGWMVAAIASAVTGLALLSFASKTQTIEV